MERQEQDLEIQSVRVKVMGQYADDYGDVREIMYAEQFVMLTVCDPEGVMHRIAYPYSNIQFINTILKPPMPVIGEVQQRAVQDEVVRKDDTHRSSGRPTSMKTPPDGTVTDRLRELGITLTEAQDEE